MVHWPGSREPELLGRTDLGADRKPVKIYYSCSGLTETGRIVRLCVDSGGLALKTVLLRIPRTLVQEFVVSMYPLTGAFQSATVPKNVYSLELSTPARVVKPGLDTLT